MVRLGDTNTGAAVVQIDPHFQAPVNAVSFLPNGNSLVAASFHQIAVIDVKTAHRIVAWRPINTYVHSTNRHRHRAIPCIVIIPAS